MPSESALIFLGINIILALSLYVPFAAGQFSLGVAGFMAVGAYSSGVLTTMYGVPLVPATLMAAVAAGAVGLVIAVPTRKLQGLYLAFATVGFAEIIRVSFENWDYVGGKGGLSGMSGTTLELVWIAVAIVAALLYLLSRSRIGRAAEILGQDELAAGVLGVNRTAVKLLAPALGAAIAGIGGALYAHYLFVIQPSNFGLGQTLSVVTFTIFGGHDSLFGAMLGATILTLIPEYIRPIQEWQTAVYGGLLVLMMIVRPQGVLARSTERRLRHLLVTRRRPAGTNEPAESRAGA